MKSIIYHIPHSGDIYWQVRSTMSKKDSKDSRISAIMKFLRLQRNIRTKTEPQREYSLEELVAVVRRKTKGDIERLKKATEVQEKAELLYRLDPLLFASINRLRRAIVSNRIYFVGGTEEDIAKMNEWARKVKLFSVLWDAVFDILVYGYSIIEKVRDDSGKIVKLVVVDPKTIDWKKDGDRIVLDEEGEPEGYIQETDEGEVELKREDVIHLKFFSLGRECLGISPLEPAYNASWIRLNLEVAFGEATYRHGFPLHYFRIGDEEHPVTPELIKEARRILRDMETASELILPTWIEPGVLEVKSPIGQVSELWSYLAASAIRALDNPLTYASPAPGRESKGGVEFSTLDFENAAQQYQALLRDQLEEQLFAEVRVQLELNSVPELAFGTWSPETTLAKLQTIADLTEKGVLHVDRNLENAVREQLGIPHIQETEVKEERTSCVYFPSEECQIRKESKVPLSELFKYCQQCPRTKSDKLIESHKVAVEVKTPLDEKMKEYVEKEKELLAKEKETELAILEGKLEESRLLQEKLRKELETLELNKAKLQKEVETIQDLASKERAKIEKELEELTSLVKSKKELIKKLEEDIKNLEKELGEDYESK